MWQKPGYVCISRHCWSQRGALDVNRSACRGCRTVAGLPVELLCAFVCACASRILVSEMGPYRIIQLSHSDAAEIIHFHFIQLCLKKNKKNNNNHNNNPWATTVTGALFPLCQDKSVSFKNRSLRKKKEAGMVFLIGKTPYYASCNNMQFRKSCVSLPLTEMYDKLVGRYLFSAFVFLSKALRNSLIPSSGCSTVGGLCVTLKESRLAHSGESWRKESWKMLPLTLCLFVFPHLPCGSPFVPD